MISVDMKGLSIGLTIDALVSSGQQAGTRLCILLSLSYMFTEQWWVFVIIRKHSISTLFQY